MTPTDADPAMLIVRAIRLMAGDPRAGVPARPGEAVDLLRRAVDAVAPGHPLRAAALSSLGLGLQTRYASDGDPSDLDEAVEMGRAALDSTPPGHPSLGTTLGTFGMALHARAVRTGDRAELDESIGACLTAEPLLAAGDPTRAAALFTAANGLLARFGWTGDARDLDAAVDAARAGIRATAAGHPDRVQRLLTFADLLRRRSRPTDLDELIAVTREARAAVPADSAAHRMLTVNLTALLTTRFEYAGDPSDVDEAADLGRAAVAATTPDDPHRAAALTNLGLVLRSRYERFGDEADLDEAIVLSRAAVDAGGPDDPEGGTWLANLGAALGTAFAHAGRQSDLDEAIAVTRRAVDATPADDPDRAVRLANLGRALRSRFQRTGDRSDIDGAVEAGRAAADTLPADRPERSNVLSSLSSALLARSEETGNRADADDAVTAATAAVTEAAPGDPFRAMYLSNLATARHHRFRLTGDPADLDAAIETGRAAVGASPADGPTHATHLINLSQALRDRFELRQDPGDADAAVTAGRAAHDGPATPPHLRAAGALAWGRAAATAQRWGEAVDGYTAACALLGLVAPRRLARGDQEHQIEDLSGLGPEAATCCVHAGMPGRALELLEQGRGVLLGQALDSRTDVTDLHERHPELARRFTTLRDDLDRAVTTGPAPLRDTADAFDAVIAEIRSRPGFDRFLRPPTVSELTAAACDGPVVVVNVSRYGAHALILTRDGVLEPVALPGVSDRVVVDRVEAFLSAVSVPTRRDLAPAGGGRRRLADTVEWLWDAVARPVLERLGVSGPPAPGRPWPRIWWCASGLLSFLPLHAAGHHGTRLDPEPATVVDRVVSSYTPTVRALLHARRGAAARPVATTAVTGPPAATTDRVVVVAMPHTDGASDLPAAREEAAWLRARFADRVTVLMGASATHDAVLAALPSARWAHFACHAAGDLTDPSGGRLLLADHRHRPMTVVDIARLRLDDADLAYLSACATARPGGRLTDEAIHLASAFQLAGYRHVIATLWPIGDADALSLAEDVYGALSADGGDAALAVHAACRRFRERWPDTPSVWASHIHSGA